MSYIMENKKSIFRLFVKTSDVLFDVVCQLVNVLYLTGWGRIVNTSSQMGMISQVGKTPYSATKAGIIGFTKVSRCIPFNSDGKQH